MKELTQQVNQIKIAAEDGMQEVALAALSDLKRGMNTLGETCSICHKKDEKEYPGDTINNTAARLEESLLTGTLKDQGRELGTLAVTACAQCHGTHRLAYDSRNLFVEKQGWRELMKH
jgi:cytochrome c553